MFNEGFLEKCEENPIAALQLGDSPRGVGRAKTLLVPIICTRKPVKCGHISGRNVESSRFFGNLWNEDPYFGVKFHRKA